MTRSEETERQRTIKRQVVLADPLYIYWIISLTSTTNYKCILCITLESPTVFFIWSGVHLQSSFQW
jgi:hypothetical protein